MNGCAKAPGKVVLSGAYAVLVGAPGLVTAVDRYVVADASRQAEFITPEVREALATAEAPWFDASALRVSDRKLGLGSSAAILAATLAALRLANAMPIDMDAVFQTALGAHARAQGGGSGIDVAASCFGGTLLYTLSENGPQIEPVVLPPDLVLEIWWSGRSAATADLLAQVQSFAKQDPIAHRTLLTDQGDAARRTAEAIRHTDAGGFLEGLAAQHLALAALGAKAGVPIVTASVAELHQRAQREAAVVLPAGAGGGDIALYAGLTPPSTGLREFAKSLNHQPLSLGLAARGVHAART